MLQEITDKVLRRVAESADSDIDSDYDDGTIETVGQLVDFVAASVKARAAGRSAS